MIKTRGTSGYMRSTPFLLLVRTPIMIIASPPPGSSIQKAAALHECTRFREVWFRDPPFRTYVLYKSFISHGKPSEAESKIDENNPEWWLIEVKDNIWINLS